MGPDSALLLAAARKKTFDSHHCAKSLGGEGVALYKRIPLLLMYPTRSPSGPMKTSPALERVVMEMATAVMRAGVGMT